VIITFRKAAGIGSFVSMNPFSCFKSEPQGAQKH
jgi:hypothetical protein